MAGILPDAVNGGLIKRDTAGNCLSPVNVVNAYCPPLGFTTTCDITALPSDCTARITAAQMNAIVSEMLCLAVALTPTGTWSCASVCNLSSAFTAWKAVNGIADGLTIDGAGTPADPYALSPTGAADALAATPAALSTLMLALDLTDCAGTNHVVGASIPSCAELNAAIAGVTIPAATDTVQGKVALAVAANYPQPANDVDAATPAYVAQATSPTALAASLAFVDQCGDPIVAGAALHRSGLQTPVLVVVARSATTSVSIASNPAFLAPTAGVVTVASDPNFFAITNNFCTPALLVLLADSARNAIDLGSATRAQVWLGGNAQMFDQVTDNTGKVWGSTFSQACDDAVRSIHFYGIITPGSTAVLAPGETRTFSRYAGYFNPNAAGQDALAITSNMSGLQGYLMPIS